jgi:hypothetical protein
MCNNPLCKFINIIEIYDGVNICIHYNDDDEPILIQYWNENNCFARCFIPKNSINFVELGKFCISKDEIKNEHFDLTDIIELDA